MCSVSLRRVRSPIPIPVSRWTGTQRQIARKAAERALYGVGIRSTDVVEQNLITLSVRRLCTDDERSRVTENYLQD